MISHEVPLLLSYLYFLYSVFLYICENKVIVIVDVKKDITYRVSNLRLKQSI